MCAAALYLLHAQHLSVERTAPALAEMLGVPVSTGFVASLAQEAAGALAPFLAELAERLVSSSVVHVDETSDQVRKVTLASQEPHRRDRLAGQVTPQYRREQPHCARRRRPRHYRLSRQSSRKAHLAHAAPS